MDVAVGVAHGEHGVPGGQGLGRHPTAALLAWSQPPWVEEAKKSKRENAIR